MVSGTKTVLMVDDEPDICEAVALALSEEGFKVLVAKDGVAALSAAAQTPPAVVLLDYYMPGTDLAELVPKLRGQCPAADLVLVTAGDCPEDKARELGVEHHLAKPFELENMLALVRQLTSTQ